MWHICIICTSPALSHWIHYYNHRLFCLFLSYLISLRILTIAISFLASVILSDLFEACRRYSLYHHSDVIMGPMASLITSLTIVYSTVYSGADQRKYQSSASLVFVRGIHRWPVNSLHKWPVTRKMFPLDDVIVFIFPTRLITEVLTHKISTWWKTHSYKVALFWWKPFSSLGQLRSVPSFDGYFIRPFEKNGRNMPWQYPSFRLSLCFPHVLRYQFKFIYIYIYILGDTTCQVWVLSQLGHFTAKRLPEWRPCDLLHVLSLGTVNQQGIHWCWQTGVLGSLWLLLFWFAEMSLLSDHWIKLHWNTLRTLKRVS